MIYDVRTDKERKLKAVGLPIKLHKTALGTLQAAYDILKRKGRWIQNDFSVDCEGQALKKHRDPKAVAFCALGAVRFVDGPGEKKATKLLADAALEVIKLRAGENGAYLPQRVYGQKDDIFSINDDYGWDEVKEMFRRAIAKAKSRK